MSYVKGLVLLSRFEYLDAKKGLSALKELLKIESRLQDVGG